MNPNQEKRMTQNLIMQMRANCRALDSILATSHLMQTFSITQLTAVSNLHLQTSCPTIDSVVATHIFRSTCLMNGVLNVNDTRICKREKNPMLMNKNGWAANSSNCFDLHQFKGGIHLRSVFSNCFHIKGGAVYLQNHSFAILASELNKTNSTKMVCTSILNIICEKKRQKKRSCSAQIHSFDILDDFTVECFVFANKK